MRVRGIVALVFVALLAACSGSGGKGATATSGTTGTTAAATTSSVAASMTVPAPLHILVTNDDGVGAPGIDAIVEALRKLPGTVVDVVAPATNESGQGSKTTAGALTVGDAKTKSGYSAKAVQGFPVDTIVWAIDQGGVSPRPDLVISGINDGQNLGKFVAISGTVGAARAAAQRGIPALAVSQGLGSPADFPSGVRAALAWLASQRAALIARRDHTTPATVTNLNIPTCTSGTPRPVVKTTVAGPNANPFAKVDCTGTAAAPRDDVDAFLHGFVTETDNLPLKSAS